MISFDDAIAIITDVAQPLGKETVALAAAAGRVLAEPVIAGIDSPRADVSAMDGYAVREGDLQQFPVCLTVRGESVPGSDWEGTLEPGTCVRIFTGAPLPAGANRIVMQERMRRDGPLAILDAPPGPATWVRLRGKDFEAGDQILPPGRMLDPAALIAAAGADCGTVTVHKCPRMALLSTGDELVEPGSARDGSLVVPDSASLGVSDLARHWGAQLVYCQRVHDDRATLETAARAAAAISDVIVVTGGASVGERDFAKAMFAPLGLVLGFSKVAIRPGKPAWFGTAGDVLVIGLPGNPTSALVAARLLLAPLLATMSGRPRGQALQWEPAVLAAPLPACDARETFHRGHLCRGQATPTSFQESHAQKALAAANVLLRQGANSPSMAPGDQVETLRF
jgi:molybdopterin molybdotransferase